MRIYQYFIMIFLLFLSFIYCPYASGSDSLTLYDDFGDNTFNYNKWMIDSSEYPDIVTEEDGVLKIAAELDQGEGVKCFLLGPDQTFGALEAKVKLSSKTDLVESFGIGARWWNDGVFDYCAYINFIRLFPEDPLSIEASIVKILGEKNSYEIYPYTWQAYHDFKTILSPASFDTWYRMRLEFDNSQVQFYLKEGEGNITEEDLQHTYTIEGDVKSSNLNYLYLMGENNFIYQSTTLEGSIDEVYVGNPSPTYTLSGKVEGILPDQVSIALYRDTFPIQTQKVGVEGNYSFRFLSNLKTYKVGYSEGCYTFHPLQREVTIWGGNQTDINFILVESTEPQEDNTLALAGGKLIDGNGGEPLDNSLVIIKGSTIQTVSQLGETSIPEGTYIIDAQGKTILPGLFDMHLHISTEPSPCLYPMICKEEIGIEYQKRLYALLFCGVTSILDLHHPDEILILGLREKEREHCFVSPRIFAVGNGITYQRGYPSGLYFMPPTLRFVSSPEEARKEIQDLAQKAPDVVKLFYEDSIAWDWPTFDIPTLEALIDESKLQGLKTIVHAGDTELAKEVAHLNAHAFAHLPIMDDELVALMRGKNMSCTPTLAWTSAPVRFADNPDFIDDSLIRASVDPRLLKGYEDPELIEAVQNSPITEKFRTLIPKLYNSLKRLYEEGIQVTMGTDAGMFATFHGSSVHEGLRIYVEAGLTPMQAIMTATYNAAEFLEKLDHQGTIEEGKLADLLIIKEDPLEDITNTKKISLVIKNGEIINRGKLSRDNTGRLCEEAKHIANRIDLLPDFAFRRGDAYYKTILTERMEEIYSILKDADDETSSFNKLYYLHSALLLVVNVMPFIDGCSNYFSHDDLITNCTYQQTLYSLTQQLLIDCITKVVWS